MNDLLDPVPCTHDGAVIYRRGMCRADYRAWLTRKRAHELADEHPRVAISQWDRTRKRSGKTGRARAEGKFGVGPSDLNACPKAVEYRENPPADYEPVETDRSGAWIGSLLDGALKRARKVRYSWRRFDVPVHVPGLDSPGEADEYDPIIGRVVDYKTAGKWKWDRLGEDGPPEGEWEQLAVYGLGLEEAGEHVTELEIIALNREKGHFESFRRPYNRNAAIAALSRLHAMMDALHAGRSLERSRLGPTTDSICARFCPAVRHCWNLDEVPEDRTPESWLLVHDDATIEQILTDYVAASAQETPAKNTKSYLSKALLTGIPEGRYGDITLKWTGGNVLDPKPDLEARTEQLEQQMRLHRELGVPIPDPEDLPFPTRTDTSRVAISIRPVRKAILEQEARDRAKAEEAS